MPRTKPQRFEIEWIALDAASPIPLFRQLEGQLRAAVASGILRRGERLPSTRSLAEALRIGRNTAMAAYEQLTAEGYLESANGSGTRVSSRLPSEGPAKSSKAKPRPSLDAPRLSRRGETIERHGSSFASMSRGVRPFRAHVPAIDETLSKAWSRVAERRVGNGSTLMRESLDPLGYLPLRQAIADYLGVARGVACSADRIVVTAGTQQALDLIAKLLLDLGDPFWIEDPGYAPGRYVFELAGGEAVGVPVDEEGLDVAAGIQAADDARLVYSTPSCQWPTAVTMSLSRRLALLDWARRRDAWILEDDYNGEFRYSGPPTQTLFALDNGGERTIFLGTFSKVLFPALRLAYMVVPEHRVDAFAAARWLADRHSPPYEQAILAQFIQEGLFARHVRRMRKLYAVRQAALIDALRSAFGDELEVTPREAGMQTIAYGRGSLTTELLSEAADRAGLEVFSTSTFAMNPAVRPGLILGFAPFEENALFDAAKRWESALARGSRPASEISGRRRK